MRSAQDNRDLPIVVFSSTQCLTPALTSMSVAN